jgi:hypothetical protein
MSKIEKEIAELLKQLQNVEKHSADWISINEKLTELEDTLDQEEFEFEQALLKSVRRST